MSIARNRDALKQALLQSPDPVAMEFEQVISVLPSIVYQIRRHLPQVTSSIPHDPGGRPEALPDVNKKKQICTEIGVLYAQGVLLGDAFKRLARKFDVSERTIRRVWRDRARVTK